VVEYIPRWFVCHHSVTYPGPLSINYVTLQVSVHMMTDEGIDWWSKYYASIGETGRCRHYIELGYDKIQVRYTLVSK